jgi:hypothetical protein
MIYKTEGKVYQHCKKRLLIFPSSAGMSLTKLSLNNLIIPGQWDMPSGDGKTVNLFLQCRAPANGFRCDPVLFCKPPIPQLFSWV